MKDAQEFIQKRAVSLTSSFFFHVSQLNNFRLKLFVHIRPFAVIMGHLIMGSSPKRRILQSSVRSAIDTNLFVLL